LLFHPLSLELTIAIAVVGILPVVLAYLTALVRWRSVLRLEAALIVTFAYLIVFVGMALLHFNFERVQRGGMSFGESVWLSVLIVNVTFPALLLTIAFLVITLLAWKSRIARLVLLSISLLMQALYLINLIIVASGGEVLSV
jgi:hypothetical protein